MEKSKKTGLVLGLVAVMSVNTLAFCVAYDGVRLFKQRFNTIRTSVSSVERDLIKFRDRSRDSDIELAVDLSKLDSRLRFMESKLESLATKQEQPVEAPPGSLKNEGYKALENALALDIYRLKSIINKKGLRSPDAFIAQSRVIHDLSHMTLAGYTAEVELFAHLLIYDWESDIASTFMTNLEDVIKSMSEAREDMTEQTLSFLSSRSSQPAN